MCVSSCPPRLQVRWFVDLLKDEPCDGDVFDLLFELSDFEEFKKMMLAFKMEQAARDSDAAARSDMEIKRMKIYSEEQEDGDHRPDLDMSSLCIRPLAN